MIACFFWIWSAVALASVESDFAAANDALAKGDLAAAESGYRALIDAGLTDGDVYYNLGNVCFRQDRIPAAILAWRIAAARMPRDPDVQANLDFARRRVRDHLDVVTPHPWFAPWQVALTAAEAQWIGAAVAGVGLLLIAARRRAPALPFAGVGVGFVAVGMLVGGGGIVQAREPAAAVILAPEVTVTSDLGGGVDLFTLHAGAEVLTVEEASGKLLIRLPDNRRGWVDASAVGWVDPERPLPVL